MSFVPSALLKPNVLRRLPRRTVLAYTMKHTQEKLSRGCWWACLWSFALSGSSCLSQQTLSPSITSGTAALSSISQDALAMLSKHRSAMGTMPLQYLQGEGTIILAGSKASLPVSLVLSGSSFVRVRITTEDRLTGFAARGSLHKSYYADGTASIDGMGPGPASISAFQMLRTADTNAKLVSLLYAPFTDTNGKHFDELRAWHVVGQSANTKASAMSTSTEVDYLFDPATNCLVKSLTKVHVPGIANAVPVETNYEDYRKVGEQLIPFRIVQYLNGQADWVMNLSTITLPETLSSSELAF